MMFSVTNEPSQYETQQKFHVSYAGRNFAEYVLRKVLSLHISGFSYVLERVVHGDRVCIHRFDTFQLPIKEAKKVILSDLSKLDRNTFHVFKAHGDNPGRPAKEVAKILSLRPGQVQQALETLQAHQWIRL